MNKKTLIKSKSTEIKPILYYIILAILCFVLYGQSINNNFNIDDDYVYENHKLVQQGISGIPEIFTTRYNTKDEQYFGYRPLTIAIYAIEFEIFGMNSHSAHFINILYYIICCSLLFYFLSLLLKDKIGDNVKWYAFLITIVFATNALHTEVVLSLKNREEIISLIFSILASIFALKFYSSKKFIPLIITVICLALAFLAKESAIVFIVLIPLTIIFFKTDLKIFSKFHINKDVFPTAKSLNGILTILLFLMIFLFLLFTPDLKINRTSSIPLHSIDLKVNPFIAWIAFFLVYTYIIYIRRKTENSIKFTTRNIILWLLTVLSIATIVFTKSYLLGFISFFILLWTLLPEKRQPIFQIKLFENLSKKIVFSILTLLVISGIVLALAYFIPKQSMPETNAPVFKWQNPSFDNESTIFDKIAIALYSFIYYIKLLIIPSPLRFYYGYKMIPDVHIYNPIVIISLLVNLFLLFIAFKNFNKRSMISYGILFYFIAIFPFSNTFFPLTGIIAERMVFTPSIGFSIVIVFLAYKLLKFNENSQITNSLIFKTLLLTGIIILPNTIISLNRNKDWKDRKTLYTHDIEYLENSAKANTLYANLIIGEVYAGIKNKIPVQNFQNDVNVAIKYFTRATKIDSTYSNPWHNLGYINMLLYKNYPLAEQQFSKCLAVDSTIAAAYLNRGITNYYLKNYKQSIKDLEDYINKNKNYKDKEYDKAYVFSAKSYFELRDTANTNRYYGLALDNLKSENLSQAVLDDLKKYFQQVKDYKQAIRISNMEIQLNPNIDVPYVDKGNYYFLQGDTLTAMTNWELAFEKFKGNFNIGMTLSNYYRGIGNIEKADYFYNTAMEFKMSQKPQDNK